MKITLLILLLFVTQGCMFKKTISHDKINLKMLKIDIADGIDDKEAMVIAQHFLISEENSRCSKDIQQLNTRRPSVSDHYSSDKVYMVQFSWVGFQKIKRVFPMSVSVNKKTGLAKCVGQIVRK